MVIGEAGESCAFYIADRLGMPAEMLAVAIEAAYGKDAVENYAFAEKSAQQSKNHAKISKMKSQKPTTELTEKFKRGDSVMVYPDKKIYINHKRVKLHVAASELYPEDYDFSIIFETVENRKKRHDMERKYTQEIIQYED